MCTIEKAMNKQRVAYIDAAINAKAQSMLTELGCEFVHGDMTITNGITQKQIKECYDKAHNEVMKSLGE